MLRNGAGRAEGTVDRIVSAGDVSLHYRETGEPDGLPVVAVHGHPGTAAGWDEAAALVCAAGRYRFLAVTLRGYGSSDRVGPYSFERFSDDVFAFASALGVERFVLLGHSMGGAVASLAATREPDRLLGLVLEDSVLPREGTTLKVPERPETEPPPYDWDLAPAIFGQLERPDPGWWPALARITAPTLVIAGGCTSHVPQDLLAEAAEQISGAALVTLEGAGHSVHRTEPERFAATLTSYLSRRVR